MSELLIVDYHDHPWVVNFWKAHDLRWRDRYEIERYEVDTINIALLPWHGIFIPKTIIKRAGVIIRVPFKIVFESEAHMNWFVLRWS